MKLASLNILIKYFLINRTKQIEGCIVHKLKFLFNFDRDISFKLNYIITKLS